MSDPRIAVTLYTLRDSVQTPADIARTLQRVSEIGYNTVQLSGLGPIGPAELKRMLDDAGLGVCITHESWERLENSLDDVIADHLLWGCRNVAVGGAPSEYRNADGCLRFAREASTIGRELVQAGLTFSYHNHYWELEKFGNRRGLEIIFEEADHNCISAELDVYWLAYAGADPAMWIRKMSGRAPVCHFKDMAISGEKQVMTEVGDGNLNWSEITQACCESGVEWCVVEHDECAMDPFDSIARSYENMVAMGLKA